MKLRTSTQISFAEAEYTKKKKQTRREKFLAEMEHVVPWTRLLEVIALYYPKSGRRGRPPIGLERMLRMYFIRQWYGLADEAVEDAVYDSQALRQFLAIDLSVESVPDSTTLMGFRHRLEAHKLTQAMLVEIKAMLIERGLLMSKGTLVDATLIAAPRSTKNQAHIGADDESGLVHTVITTAANVSDISQTPALLHGQEEVVGGDAGYVGVEKREEMKVALATNGQVIEWRIAKRRKAIKKMAEGWRKDLAQTYEKLKSRIRARVEHPFHVIKNLFHYKKTRYQGIAKNDTQLNMLFGLGNLYMMRGELRP